MSSELTTVRETLAKVRSGVITIDDAHLWFAEQIKAGRALPRPIKVELSGEFPLVDGHVLMWNEKTSEWCRKVDCQNEGTVTVQGPDGKKTITIPQLVIVETTDIVIEPEPPRAPITDDEREAELREEWEGFLDEGPDSSVSDDVVFLLRRLDELRASIAPAPAPAHNWIARLGGPFVPPA